MKDLLAGKISIHDLMLQSKALEPLSTSALEELSRVQNLKHLNSLTEADVREEIVTPVLRALGYDKGSYFSVDREKKLDFIDKRRFIDYSMTLFEENFWLIEAKRPNFKKDHFEYTDFQQALEYAVHPEINAALVVMCDGEKIEVFDRETSVLEPMLHIKRANLIEDFDKLRILLSPWQIWFFEKRRIVRSLDKVFSGEMNLERAEEFKQLVERRIDSKRFKILDNFRN